MKNYLKMLICEHEWEVVKEIKKEVEYLGKKEEVTGIRKECTKCQYSRIDTYFKKLN